MRDDLLRLLEDSGEGLLVVDANLQCIYGNAIAVSILNRAGSSLIGSSLTDFFLPIVHPEATEFALRVLHEKRPITVNHYSLTLHAWFHIRYVPVQTDTVLISFHDVTAHYTEVEALRISEARFRAMCEAIPLGILITDAQGNCHYANPAWGNMTGISPSITEGTGWLAAIHPDDRIHASAAWHDAVRAGIPYDSILRIQKTTGAICWMHLRAVGMYTDGQLQSYVATGEDITEFSQAQEAINEYQRFIENVVNATPDIIYIYDLREQRNIYVNREIYLVLGYHPEEIGTLGTTFTQVFIYPEDNTALQAHATMRDSLPPGQFAEVEYRMRHKDGSYRWLWSRETIFSRDEQGAPTQVFGIAQDITHRKFLEAERERLLSEAEDRADHDALTWLYNHGSFHRRLAEEERRARGSNSTFGIAVLDVDNFKFFNDAYGHAAGDEVLLKVAQVLKSACRGTDIVGRVGGDEFAVLMPGLTSATVEEAGYRLRRAIGKLGYRPHESQSDVPLGLAVGVAVFPEEGSTAADVYRVADEKLYQAKHGSKRSALRAEELRRQAEDLIPGFAMIDALVSAVDSKDRYTRRHSEDVLLYVTRLAEAIRLPEVECSALSLAALLHDVGKIAIPDKILRLPGALSPEQFEMIKQHAPLGASIVASVPGLEATIDAVRHHHEAWDGSGYPDNLAGENIPFTARLLAIADSYSAMTTDRPYRKGLSHANALHILQEGSGKQWDPALVVAFCQALANYKATKT